MSVRVLDVCGVTLLSTCVTRFLLEFCDVVIFHAISNTVSQFTKANKNFYIKVDGIQPD